MDICQRDGNGLLHTPLHHGLRFRQLCLRHEQGGRIKMYLVKSGGIVKKGFIPARGNILDNSVHGIPYGILREGAAVHPALHFVKAGIGRTVNFHKKSLQKNGKEVSQSLSTQSSLLSSLISNRASRHLRTKNQKTKPFSLDRHQK